MPGPKPRISGPNDVCLLLGLTTTTAVLCGLLLFEYRLNSNFHDPRDGQIWQVPGFCGLDHVCPDFFEAGSSVVRAFFSMIKSKLNYK